MEVVASAVTVMGLELLTAILWCMAGGLEVNCVWV